MKGIDKICVLESINGRCAKAQARELHPDYYTFTYKSLAGRKQHPLERGKVTKYKLYLKRRKRK